MNENILRKIQLNKEQFNELLKLPSGSINFNYRGFSVINYVVNNKENVFEAYDGKDIYRAENIDKLDILLDEVILKVNHKNWIIKQ